MWSGVSNPWKMAENNQIFNGNQHDQCSIGNYVHKICRQVSVKGSIGWLFFLRGKTWWLLGICGFTALSIIRQYKSAEQHLCLLLAPDGFLLGNLVKQKLFSQLPMKDFSKKPEDKFLWLFTSIFIAGVVILNVNEIMPCKTSSSAAVSGPRIPQQSLETDFIIQSKRLLHGRTIWTSCK